MHALAMMSCCRSLGTFLQAMPLWQCGVRVLHFAHSSKPYGSQLQVLDLVKGSREAGVDPVVVVSEEGQFADLLRKNDIKVLGPDRSRNWLNNRSRFQWYRKWLINCRLVNRWAKNDDVRSADLIHSHSLTRPFGAMIAKAIGKPHVWHIHEQAMPHLNRPFLMSQAWVKRWIGTRADQAIVPSESLARWAQTYFEEDRIVVVPNGLLEEPGAFPHARRLSPTLSPVRIAVIGRLGETKGSLDAIQTLRYLREAGIDAEMRFTGDAAGPFRQEIDQLAARLGVAEKVSFIGYLDNVSPELDFCDVLLMPSRYESFGRVTVEAMAAGRSVVATASGGTLEVVQDGVTGLLRSPGRPDEFAEAIQWLLEHPREAERMRYRAWCSAYGRYSRDDFVHRVHDVYSRALASSHNIWIEGSEYTQNSSHARTARR